MRVRISGKIGHVNDVFHEINSSKDDSYYQINNDEHDKSKSSNPSSPQDNQIAKGVKVYKIIHDDEDY